MWLRPSLSLLQNPVQLTLTSCVGHFVGPPSVLPQSFLRDWLREQGPGKVVGQLPVASAHWADSGGLSAGARKAQRPCAGVVPWITADLVAMKQQPVRKLGDHWAIHFSSRFTAPRWTARPPALCRGPVVALSPPPQALHPLPHSSAWLPWAVVHHQRSEDMCGVGDGDSHVGQRLKLSVQTLG